MCLIIVTSPLRDRLFVPVQKYSDASVGSIISVRLHFDHASVASTDQNLICSAINLNGKGGQR